MTLELWDIQELVAQRFADSELGFYLLGDDMGLGKTATGLSGARRRRLWRRVGQGPILAITLKSARGQFEHHLELLGIDPASVTITHWEDLLQRGKFVCSHCDGKGEDCKPCKGKGTVPSRPNPKYVGRRWSCVIADEAHKIKNRKAKQTLALKAIKTDSKIAMTGTAIVNSIADLWSILNWFDPIEWSSYWQFYTLYVAHVQHTKGKCASCGGWHARDYREEIGIKNAQQLIDRITPYFIVRKKKRCMSSSCVDELGYPGKPHDHLVNLPDFLEPVIYDVELTGPQRRAYEQMREEDLAWIGPFGNDPVPAPIAISRLMRLRQFASAYMQVIDVGKYRMTEPSGKLDVLMDIIEGTDEPLVVFSMFTQLINLARARLEKAGIEHFWLTGETPDKNRNDWMRYQAGERKVFLANILAGGQGIDLFRASTVVFLDRAWTPKDNNQARDRLWRNGQVKGVQQIFIEAVDTVDKEKESRLQFKGNIIKQILGGSI